MIYAHASSYERTACLRCGNVFILVILEQISNMGDRSCWCQVRDLTYSILIHFFADITAIIIVIITEDNFVNTLLVIRAGPGCMVHEKNNKEWMAHVCS